MPPRRQPRSMSARDTGSPSSPSGRTAKVNRSCMECTRRKIKCDGEQPCGSCIYYHVAETCGYRQRSKRHAVSRSTYDKASEQLRVQSLVLDTLFPGAAISDLATRSQEELVHLLTSRLTLPLRHAAINAPSQQPIDCLSPGADGEDPGFSGQSAGDDSAPLSENGEPTGERQWDESLDQPSHVATDDVNALGLITDQRARSYLGTTSMGTVMRAIFRLCPASKEQAADCARIWAATPPTSQPSYHVTVGRNPAADRLREQRCIDGYFEHLHTITPLLNEDEFRREYTSGNRTDGSWMGLLNMVLAMGSIASGSDHLHEHYYRQARTFTSLDSLGSGNLEGLQALCILGGWYLHYRNSPNMAYGIMGAAHRVAIALGLHREPRRNPIITDAHEAEAYRRKVETRRRTWWSLFCLDTWACMTQGRPTCGRWEATTMDTFMPRALHRDDHAGTSLHASVQFCLIHNRIQHRFAQPGRPSTREMLTLEDELQTWYDSLPPIMREAENPPPGCRIAREFVRTRYLNSRVILSRSLMLYVAHDCKRKTAPPTPEQQRTVEAACQLGADAVDAISLYWTQNRIHVWDSAWHLFQTCAIPLLGMALDHGVPHAVSASARDLCSPALSKALETFAEMRPWMRASDRTPDIVAALYEALGSAAADADAGADVDLSADAVTRTPSATDSSIDLFGWDDQLTRVDLSLFIGEDPMQDLFSMT